MGKILGKLLITVLISSIVLMGCSSSTNTQEEKKGATTANDSAEKDTLRIAIASSPASLDVHRLSQRLVQQVGSGIYESLVTMDENNNIVPMLAKSVETSEDGKTITFKLRDGVKFHNGKELGVDDVVASLNRWGELSFLGRAALSKTTIKAQGDDTVVIVSEEPMGTVLTTIATPVNQAAIMPKEIVENAPPQGAREYIGTGPYKFVEWKQDQYIHLQRFEDYQAVDGPTSGLGGKKEAKIEHLYYYTVPDRATRVAGLQSGEYDFADELPYDNYEMIHDDPNLVTVISEHNYNTIAFNTRDGVFQNKKARQAVNAALDMDAIAMAMTGNPNFYNLNLSMATKEMPWYTEVGKENYNQNDLEKAKELLEESGYKGEPVTIISTKDYDDIYKATLVIQGQLERIGMTTNIEVYDYATLTGKGREDKGWDLFPITFSLPTDPSHPQFLDSRNKFFGTTEHPEMDNLLDKYRSSLTVEEQKAVYEEIQQLFWEDVRYIKTTDIHTVYAYNKKLKDYRDLKTYPLWNTYIE